MVRCFEDDDVTHVEGKIDPLADIETIETELMLADLDSLEKRVDRAREEGARAATRKRRNSLDLINRALALLREGKPARLRRAQAGGGAGLRDARPPDLEAGALRLQRRGERRPTTGNDYSRKVDGARQARRARRPS